ncbi:hypothetical protein N7512_003886 [Penicillium capsulatum]|nr:hypothetical protein N7512_003886 [Penicillium capsulatum]
MSPKCNASAPPPRISPDNDITGVGVLANYIGTAGVAILVILVYFLVVYEPARDPFNKVDAYFHPNPVDDTLLTWLVTGLSVMISGFVQFRSGISTYHFVMIVYLAYFSTVTHLSCLTALRQYLHDHKIERQWRLLGMTLLAILLIVGLAFTGNYDWAVSLNPGKRPGPGDYAACYIDVTSGALVGVLSTITSIFFVALALISRVIKLHGYLSRNVCGRARTWVSRSVWGPLRAMHSRLEIKKSPLHSLRRTLIYRPVLVLLLMPRVLLDLWCSVSFEVRPLFDCLGGSSD